MDALRVGLTHLQSPHAEHSGKCLLNKLSEMLSHVSFSCGKRQTLLINLMSLEGCIQFLF